MSAFRRSRQRRLGARPRGRGERGQGKYRDSPLPTCCSPGYLSPFRTTDPLRITNDLGQTTVRLPLDRTTYNLRQAPHLPIRIRIPPINHIPNQIHRITQRPPPVGGGRRVRRPEGLLARVSTAPGHRRADPAEGRRRHVARREGRCRGRHGRTVSCTC